jgi:hypothetical protein
MVLETLNNCDKLRDPVNNSYESIIYSHNIFIHLHKSVDQTHLIPLSHKNLHVQFLFF